MNKLLLVVFSLMFYACTSEKKQDVPDNYPKDSTISSTSGEPKDSLTFYFPTSIRKDSQIIQIDIDTNALNYYSSGLYCAKEKILYNYYQGHDIYRFTLLRSFFLPVYCTLQKDEDSVWIEVKVLDRQPHTITIIIGKIPNIEAKSSTLTLADEDTIKPDRQASIIYHQTIKLRLQDWNDFEKLLSNCNFWNLTPHKQDSQLDGSTWIIEGHLKTKYWYVAQLSPHGTTFENVGSYLLEKSGLPSMPIYKQDRNELP